MTGDTTTKRAAFQADAWEHLQKLIKSEGMSFRDLERVLPASRKVAARVLGGPPRPSTKSERNARAVIEAMAATIKSPKTRDEFRQLVALCKIPPEAFRCFYLLLKQQSDDEESSSTVPGIGD